MSLKYEPASYTPTPHCTSLVIARAAQRTVGVALLVGLFYNDRLVHPNPSLYDRVTHVCNCVILAVVFQLVIGWNQLIGWNISSGYGRTIGAAGVPGGSSRERHQRGGQYYGPLPTPLEIWGHCPV